MRLRWAILLLPLAVVLPAQDAPVNALPNGGFELVEPNAAGKSVPRTWDVATRGDGRVEAVPRHPGGHCLRLSAEKGAARVFYDGIPVADSATWTLTFEIRGNGKVWARVSSRDGGAWRKLLDQSVDGTSEWVSHRFSMTPGETATTLRLELASSDDVSLDNVLLGHAGLPALDLPPLRKLESDQDTLLLLDFEEDLDPFQYFLKGEVKRVPKGRFGAALHQGAGAYVATSAEDFLDPQAGTIELWVKLLVPGGERVSRPFVSVPGMRGLSLTRDQYGHISFSLNRHWGVGVRVWADGYARKWQPGVWRHVAACWDHELTQLWVDGRLLGSAPAKNLPDTLGPELRIGAPGMVIDNLRISRTVRYRVPLRPPKHAD